MTANRLIIRHLCFTGPHKQPAQVLFKAGLNVVYGASETGKSFILEAIDFMLGGSRELRDIPQRVGYESIFLGVEDIGGSSFTLERATAGGKFRCYEGLHLGRPKDVEPITLSQKHSPTNHENVSTLLLKHIGLDGMRIRKNANGETHSLSFRNLAHLCLVTEGNIQKQGSPFETEQYQLRTKELSVLKLLLSGVDDSAVEPLEKQRTRRLSHTAKMEVIDDLLSESREKLAGLVGEGSDEEELTEQFGRLCTTIEREKRALDQSDYIYRNASAHRNELRRNLEDARERRAEIGELLERFQLLARHYHSDLVRLEGISESGTLVSAMDSQSCPLCGAEPDSQHATGGCDGDVDSVVEAADAESKKIRRLEAELADTVSQLHVEAEEFDELIPEIERKLEFAVDEIQAINPELKAQRVAYSELLERRSLVESALRQARNIADLEERRAELEGTPKIEQAANEPAPELSLSTLNTFSKLYEEVLSEWNFPNSDRVYFDGPTRDFVISGKPRGARGKGMRALSHAAFTVSLLEFTRRYDLPHPGFAVLDTPLLAYREPEGDEDDLTGTGVHEQFYRHLDALSESQVIVLENVDPPADVQESANCIFFSKNPRTGRYGFF